MSKTKKRKTSHCKELEVITSENAAVLIRTIHNETVSTEQRLVVVTSDASGNGKCSGLTAVIRQMESNTTQDRVLVQLGSLEYDESAVAEIAAVALGAQTVSQQLTTLCPIKTCKMDVLFLADCRAVKSFYDKSQKSNIRDQVIGADDWIAAMDALLCTECINRVCLAWVPSTHSQISGFFDHEAADLLAVAARKPVFRDAFQTKWILAPPLTNSDIKWLEHPQKHEHGGSKKRKALCRQRLLQDFEIELH